MRGFYRLKQEKDVSICWRWVTNRYKKYDAGCTITHLVAKTRRSICTKPTVSKVFDKISRAVSVKHTSYNWRNAEATYVPFYKISRVILFTAKHTLHGTKCLFFFFRYMYYSGLIGKDWLKLKTLTKFLNSQNSILGLKLEYI